MTQHVKNPHTPHQMRVMSNAAHLIEGSIISASGVAMLIGEWSRDVGRRDLSGSLMGGAGGLLGLGLIGGSFGHGGPIEFFGRDHQQRQHLQMAGVLTVGGLARRRGRIGRIASSLAAGRIGQMFLTHEQHGTDETAAIAKGKHQNLGWSLLAAAGVGGLADLLDSKVLRTIGGGLLLASGLQLAAYREPNQAYEESNGHRSQHESQTGS